MDVPVSRPPKSRLLDDLERLLARGLVEDATLAGVTEATARLLLAVEAGEEVPMGEVADRVGRERSTITRFVDRAVAAGLAERRAGLDRRRRLLRLTPAGRKAQEGLWARRILRTRSILEAVRHRTGLDEGEVERLVEALVGALVGALVSAFVDAPSTARESGPQ